MKEGKTEVIRKIANELGVPVVEIGPLKPKTHVKYNGKVGIVVAGKFEGEFRFYHEPDYPRGYYTQELPIITSADVTVPTAEEKINYQKLVFSWGEVTDVVDIDGEYQIFKYKSRYVEDQDATIYACYMNYFPIGRSEDFFDLALVTLLAYKYEGANSQATGYIYRMLEMDKKMK